jgi:HemY protein
MRQVLAFLLVAVVVIGGAWWIDHLVGAISLQISGITVEAPISVTVVFMLLFSVAAYWAFRVVEAIFGIRHLVRRGGERATRKRGEQAVTNTLIALAAREGDAAKREVEKARRYLGDTPHTLLLAASAYNLAKDHAKAADALQKLSTQKDGAYLGLRGLLSEAVAREDWPRATELARQIEKIRPGSAWTHNDVHDTSRPSDWQEVLLLQKSDAPHAALAAAAAEAETDPTRAILQAKDAFKRDPGLPAAALAYARRLREAGKEKLAQDILRKAWARTPQPELAAMALAASPDRVARLKAGQALVSDAAESAESHLLLARLCLESGNASEAQRHADAAERAGLKQRRVYSLMADIAEAEGTDEAHQTKAREALRRAANAAADPVWQCGSCGMVHGAWHAACGNCHAVGRIRWAVPQAEVVAAAA